MVNFGPLTAEIGLGVWGTPAGFASWQHYCTAVKYWASAKLCGVEQRAPPMFGRASITLGIGPHSSCTWSTRPSDGGWLKTRQDPVYVSKQEACKQLFEVFQSRNWKCNNETMSFDEQEPVHFQLWTVLLEAFKVKDFKSDTVYCILRAGHSWWCLLFPQLLHKFRTQIAKLLVFTMSRMNLMVQEWNQGGQQGSPLTEEWWAKNIFCVPKKVNIRRDPELETTVRNACRVWYRSRNVHPGRVWNDVIYLHAELV